MPFPVVVGSAIPHRSWDCLQLPAEWVFLKVLAAEPASMSNRNNNKLPSNLPQLQNLIKRDPPAYVEEVGVRRGDHAGARGAAGYRHQRVREASRGAGIPAGHVFW